MPKYAYFNTLVNHIMLGIFKLFSNFWASKILKINPLICFFMPKYAYFNPLVSHKMLGIFKLFLKSF